MSVGQKVVIPSSSGFSSGFTARKFSADDDGHRLDFRGGDSRGMACRFDTGSQFCNLGEGEVLPTLLSRLFEQALDGLMPTQQRSPRAQRKEQRWTQRLLSS